MSYSSPHGWDERGRLDDFLSLMRRCWRTRAYGDFWSYMLLAEGAVDLAAEPELEVYDMAALDIIVREAGGRFTSLDGTDGPFGGNALASNGHLHEAALSFLGTLRRRDDDPDWPTEPAPGPCQRPASHRARGRPRDGAEEPPSDGWVLTPSHELARHLYDRPGAGSVGAPGIH